MKDFINQQEIVQQKKEGLIIPSYLLKIETPLLLLKLPYCEKMKLNQKTSLENTRNLPITNFDQLLAEIQEN